MVCISLVVWVHILRAFSVVAQEKDCKSLYIVVKEVQNCCEIKVKLVTIKLTAVKDPTECILAHRILKELPLTGHLSR